MRPGFRRVSGGRQSQPSALVWLSVGCFLVGLVSVSAVEPSAAGKSAEAKSAEGGSDYLRFERTARGEGKLETALTQFVAPDGARVELVAAVHVADGRYYRELQARFESYDRVLYEMVKPQGVGVEDLGGSGGAVSALQRGLKAVLGLEFQLEAVDYGPKNFVHADLDTRRFAELQQEKGESFLTFMLEVMRAELSRQTSGKSPASSQSLLSLLLALYSSGDATTSMKLVVAEQLADMEQLFSAVDADRDSVILAERNKVAVRRLQEALAAGHNKVAIFYGAAHMPDLERRLLEDVGCKPAGKTWITAWDIRAKATHVRRTPQGSAESPPPAPAAR